MNLRRLRLAFVGWYGLFEADVNQVGARGASGTGQGVHATRRDELGLGVRVGGEEFEDGNEIVVGELVGLAAEEAADVALGEAASPGEFALVDAAALGLTLKGDAEVAHREKLKWRKGKAEIWMGDGGIIFFDPLVQLYATSDGAQPA